MRQREQRRARLLSRGHLDSEVLMEPEGQVPVKLGHPCAAEKLGANADLARVGALADVFRARPEPKDDRDLDFARVRILWGE